MSRHEEIKALNKSFDNFEKALKELKDEMSGMNKYFRGQLSGLNEAIDKVWIRQNDHETDKH